VLIALFFVFNPYFTKFTTIWADYNKALILYGIAISFSTLQDTTKTQNNFSLKVYQNRRYSRWFITTLAIFILLMIGIGLAGMFFSSNTHLQELSVGLTVFSIGLVGALKTALEMAEYHSKAKAKVLS
jgi:hypothetical protein